MKRLGVRSRRNFADGANAGLHTYDFGPCRLNVPTTCIVFWNSIILNSECVDSHIAVDVMNCHRGEEWMVLAFDRLSGMSEWRLCCSRFLSFS